jgi:hypothetical protein
VRYFIVIYFVKIPDDAPDHIKKLPGYGNAVVSTVIYPSRNEIYVGVADSCNEDLNTDIFKPDIVRILNMWEVNYEEYMRWVEKDDEQKNEKPTLTLVVNNLRDNSERSI